LNQTELFSEEFKERQEENVLFIKTRIMQFTNVMKQAYQVNFTTKLLQAFCLTLKKNFATYVLMTIYIDKIARSSLAGKTLLC